MAITVPSSSGGGSPWAFPTQPFPLNDEGYITSDGNMIPHKGTLINNVSIPLAFSTSATGDIIGLLGTATVWTINATDINALCDGFLGAFGFWYDNINDKLYVFAVNTGTSPATYYTAYITLETGVITNIGNVQVSTNPTAATTAAELAIVRGAVDSGNFTLTFKDRTIVINESTGAEISNVASANTTESKKIGSYASLDGTTFLNEIITSTVDNSYMIMTRSNNTALIPMPSATFTNSNSPTIRCLPWGDKVKFFEIVGGTFEQLTRTYLRVDFDAWLKLAGNFGGLA